MMMSLKSFSLNIVQTIILLAVSNVVFASATKIVFENKTDTPYVINTESVGMNVMGGSGQGTIQPGYREIKPKKSEYIVYWIEKDEGKVYLYIQDNYIGKVVCTSTVGCTLHLTSAGGVPYGFTATSQKEGAAGLAVTIAKEK